MPLFIPYEFYLNIDDYVDARPRLSVGIGINPEGIEDQAIELASFNGYTPLEPIMDYYRSAVSYAITANGNGFTLNPDYIMAEPSIKTGVSCLLGLTGARIIGAERFGLQRIWHLLDDEVLVSDGARLGFRNANSASAHPEFFGIGYSRAGVPWGVVIGAKGFAPRVDYYPDRIDSGVHAKRVLKALGQASAVGRVRLPGYGDRFMDFGIGSSNSLRHIAAWTGFRDGNLMLRAIDPEPSDKRVFYLDVYLAAIRKYEAAFQAYHHDGGPILRGGGVRGLRNRELYLLDGGILAIDAGVLHRWEALRSAYYRLCNQLVPELHLREQPVYSERQVSLFGTIRYLGTIDAGVVTLDNVETLLQNRQLVDAYSRFVEEFRSADEFYRGYGLRGYHLANGGSWLIRNR